MFAISSNNRNFRVILHKRDGSSTATYFGLKLLLVLLCCCGYLLFVRPDYLTLSGPKKSQAGTLTNSEDTDNHAAFHQGLHCLLMQNRSSQNEM